MRARRDPSRGGFEPVPEVQLHLLDRSRGVAAGQGPHPQSNPLTDEEKEMFNLWVLLGAQYR